MKNKLALRASITGSIFLDDVQVSNDSLLPKAKGLGGPFACLNSARLVFDRLSFFRTKTDIYISSDTASLGAPWVLWKTVLNVHARMH